MTNDTPVKRCSKCGIEKPATREYFIIAKGCKNGLRPECKDCARIYRQQYSIKNKEKMHDYRQQRYIAKKAEIREQQRQYVVEHQEQIKKRRQEYLAKNRDRYLKTCRDYYAKNKTRLNEIGRQYRKQNPHIDRAAKLRYRARLRNLPEMFTAVDWLRCLEYWHYCCAVCGNQLRDLFGNIEPHADHWIPLNNPDCPGTIPDNMICLCTSCNTSKHDSLPTEWLSRHYKSAQAKKILKGVDDYFIWVKNGS